jgi:hypothetical protein
LFRLLVIADEAAAADRERLGELEKEQGAIASACVSELLEGSLGADQGSVSLVIEHARRAIELRRSALDSPHARAEGEKHGSSGDIAGVSAS